MDFLLGLLKEEHTRPKGIKNYEFVRSSGTPNGLSPQMVPATRDREPEILKNAKVAFFLGGEFSGWNKRGKDTDFIKENVNLASGMWFKGKGMSVVKWSKDQFLGERVLVQLFNQT